MRALRSTTAAVAILLLAGCGSSGPHAPTLARLPLLPGSRVVAQVRQCDPGTAAYCAIQFVVINRAYHRLYDFIVAQHDYLHAHGWTGAGADTGEELAADSPGHKLHLTYATASGDLDGLIYRWSHRPWQIWGALDQSMWNRQADLSKML